MQKSIIIMAGIAAFGVVSSPAHASLNDQFRCDAVGDGEHLVILDSFDPKKATVQYTIGSDNGGSTSVTDLVAEYNDGENGARYVGDDYVVLTTKSSMILMYGQGGEYPGHVECTFTNVEAPDMPTPVPMDLSGKSWGGKMRSGPGMEFDQIASLSEGEPVTIIQNTTITMNGYNWFLIRRSNGQLGYKWGGILCSNEGTVPGLYDKCL